MITCSTVPGLGGGGIGNGSSTGNGDGLGNLPTDPHGGGGSGGSSGGNHQPSDFDNYFLNDLNQNQANWLNENTHILSPIYNYLHPIYPQEKIEFARWAVEYLMNNPWITFNELLYTRTSFDAETGDFNNNTTGGYDNTPYPVLGFPQVLQDWPSVPNVIPANEFVGTNRNLRPNWHCMDYAKEQIRIKGYQISDYYNTDGQTIQIYTEQSGVDLNALSDALSYLKYALTSGIPVIVGIDNSVGSHNPDTDQTTDHFVVIVGTGVENGEIFFRFYDNASGIQHEGTHLENKLYLDNFLNMLVGRTKAEKYRLRYTDYDYIVTQIRKSKPL